MLWTGFVIGIVGSLHCIGMCGPIALALPVPGSTKWSYLYGRILYNLGRISTYSLLGATISLVGIGATLFQMQQGLSIVMGILLLIWAIHELGWIQLPDIPLITKFNQMIRSGLSSQFKNATPSSLFIIGLLNGLLPCGFVYVGLFNAALATNPLEGATAMALFGLGTFPVMFFLSYSGKWVTTNIRGKINKFMPYGLILFGLLFILRGMSLGIPYLSPKQQTDVHGNVTVNCCSKGDHGTCEKK